MIGDRIRVVGDRNANDYIRDANHVDLRIADVEYAAISEANAKWLKWSLMQHVIQVLWFHVTSPGMSLEPPLSSIVITKARPYKRSRRSTGGFTFSVPDQWRRAPRSRGDKSGRWRSPARPPADP